MKKSQLVISITVVALLSGCLGGDSEPKARADIMEGFHIYETEGFLIQAPDQWEVLTEVNFESTTPKNTLVAFRNNIRNALYTANVVVVRNELPEAVEGLDYAKALVQKTARSLTSFREISNEQMKDTIFFRSEGRESPDQDLKQFMQLSAVKAKTAYVVLGSGLATEDIDTLKKIEDTVKSFEVK